MKLNELISVKLLEQCLAQSQLYVCQIKCEKYEKEIGKEAERPVDCQYLSNKM